MLDIFTYDPHTPRKVEDIVGNTETWRSLADQIRTNRVPHLVLCGPAGCGKSLFLRIVLEYEKKRPLLYIDCTANSGLRDLRDNVRGFARGSRTNEGDFRWIVLEHADALTADTQAFLRRMMETTSNNTRFLFECADAGAIAEPILSRSTLAPVSAPDMTEVVYELKRRAGFRSDMEAVFQEIAESSRGNLRSALLNMLAVTHTSENIQDIVCNKGSYRDILKTRPRNPSGAWVSWGIEAERRCREQGLDLRELLWYGWPAHPSVAYLYNQWSRLGGISPRALFFNCLHTLITDRGVTALVAAA